MSLEGLFPGTGSYTGSTRDPMLSKIKGNIDVCQNNDEIAVSIPNITIKMEPVNVTKCLLTDDVFSQVFAEQQSTSNEVKECVTNKSNFAHSVTDAYAEIPNKELSEFNNNVIFAA